jgi:hypothetical protein
VIFGSSVSFRFEDKFLEVCFERFDWLFDKEVTIDVGVEKSCLDVEEISVEVMVCSVLYL